MMENKTNIFKKWLYSEYSNNVPKHIEDIVFTRKYPPKMDNSLFKNNPSFIRNALVLSEKFN